MCDYQGHSPLAMALTAVKNPTTRGLIPEATAYGIAQRRLEELHTKLVLNHNLDFHLVRKEWATILDPSEQERALCERNVRR